MLTVSETVLKQFDRALEKASEPGGAERCLRMVRGDDANLSLALDTPEPGDTTWEYEGRTVLAVPETCAGFCADKMLDIDDQGRLVLSQRA